MIMLDRIREIGTMRALGMQSGQVLALFLYEALFLSLGGALGGLALGFVAMGGISLYNFGEDSVMSFFLNSGHMTFSPNPLFVIANIVIIGGLTLLAALIPARMAARLEPASALRTAK
jgi:putative ABC transport system permease protein